MHSEALLAVQESQSDKHMSPAGFFSSQQQHNIVLQALSYVPVTPIMVKDGDEHTQSSQHSAVRARCLSAAFASGNVTSNIFQHSYAVA